MQIFFIMIKPLPDIETQPFGAAWWDMAFVKCNDYPIPFVSREEAQAYIDTWNFAEPQFSIWELTKM